MALLLSEKTKGKLFIPFFLLVSYVFIVSGLIVCAGMLLTYIFVWPWSKTLYRKIVTSIGYTHWCQLTFIAQWWSGTDVTITCDTQEEYEKLGSEHTLLVMNHRSGIDWIICWIMAERRRLLGGGKFIGKEAIKMVPLLGWEWIFSENVFLKRQWDKDRDTIRRDLQFLSEYPKNVWVSILMFCEGTRFTEKKHKVSMEFARKHGYPELKHHMLPRTKGFIQCIHGLKGKDFGLMDMTITFDENYAEPTFGNLLRGKKCKAEVFMKRIPLDDVPNDTDDECSEWLHELYREKDAILDHHKTHGTYKTGRAYHVPKKHDDMIVWFIWTIFLSIPLAQYIIGVMLSGSLFVKFMTLAIGALAFLCISFMIEFTDPTRKVSNYGQE